MSQTFLPLLAGASLIAANALLTAPVQAATFNGLYVADQTLDGIYLILVLRAAAVACL
ncbi:MAG: hypothetical protein AAGJ95_16155 [Cyanobacteria bacterium J06554_11]